MKRRGPVKSLNLQLLVASATPSAGALVLPSVSALGAAMPTALAADGAGSTSSAAPW